MKKAQGKQTGPKTPEGKAIVSMNALKTGERLRMFHRITHQAGRLAICRGCGEDVRQYCQEVQQCQLQDQMISAYFKAKADKNPDHIEEINLVQIASMDMLFSIKLKYALDHIEDKYFDEKTGREKHVIDTDYIYMLMNLFKSLNKSLEDMQLTRKSIDGSDAAWAALVDEKVDREEARKYLEQLRDQAEQIRHLAAESRKKREADPDIQEYQKQVGDGDNDMGDFDVNSVGENPFGTD